VNPLSAFPWRSGDRSRALAILYEWLKATGAQMSEARMRITRIPKGADLVLNEVSGAPGFGSRPLKIKDGSSPVASLPCLRMIS